jgi:HAD superfamily phosphoserine phosphatase-like hydrolase
MARKKIAFFDIDKTIYDGYLIFPLAEYFLKEQVISKSIVDTLYHDLHLYRSKQVDYEATVENFNIHLASGLKNHDPDSILALTASFLKTEEGNFFPFTEPLMELLKRTYDIYLVTGEVQCVGKAVADHFSVRGYVSTELEIENGAYSGTIRQSLAKKKGKRDAIKHIVCAYPHEDSIAFGDSEGDIDMLDTVVHAFCINSTEGLRKAALSKGWHVVTPLSILEAVKQIL